MKETEEILVSIACLTFNHEKYIEEALDSFIMQKVDFNYEIVVFDGGSSDNNRSLIQEYQRKYPNLIRSIFPGKDPGVMASSSLLFQACCGEYIAICDGDDYWSDPFKLQKQVDYLESHKDYGLVHTELDVLLQESQIIQHNINNINKIKWNLNLTSQELFEAILTGQYIIYTPTVLLRRDLYTQVVEKDKFLFSDCFLMGDTSLWAELSRITKFHYLTDSTSVYRKNFGSVSRQIDIKNKLRFKLSGAELRMYFCLKYGFSSNVGKKIKSFYKRTLFLYSVFVPDYVPMFPEIKLNHMFLFFVRNSFFRMLGRKMVNKIAPRLI